MKTWMMMAAVVGVSVLAAGCETRHTIVVEQPKPLTVNINFTGHLDLVIKDARQNLEQITGEKPTHTVNPEDLGLPPKEGSQSSSVEMREIAQVAEEVMVPVSYRARRPGVVAETFVVAHAPDDVLNARMKARSDAVRKLWDEKTGEAANGLVEARGTLTDAEKKLMAEENADRQLLFAEDAKAKGVKVEEAALSYYVARLGYAKKGAWYQKYNAATKAWEWKEWEK